MLLLYDTQKGAALAGTFDVPKVIHDETRALE